MIISKYLFNKKLLAIVIAFTLFVFVYIQNDQKKTVNPTILTAYDFTLLDRNGVSHTFGEIDKNFKVLHFWASWCEPCIDEIPKLFDFIKTNQDKSLQLILVSLDDNWVNAMSILSKFKMPRYVVSLLDSESKVADAYGSYQFPESFLINDELVILKKWVGPQEWSFRLSDEIEQ